MPKEIERSWILNDINEKYWNLIRNNSNVLYKMQYYIKIEDNEEIRYRFINNKRNNNSTYYKTIKRGSGLERYEIENEVSRYEFNDNKNKMVGNKIEKIRYVYKPKNSNLSLEFDSFISPSDYKCIVKLEIEFKSKELASKFKIKDIPCLYKISKTIIEVTDDDKYNNSVIALS